MFGFIWVSFGKPQCVSSYISSVDIPSSYVQLIWMCCKDFPCSFYFHRYSTAPHLFELLLFPLFPQHVIITSNFFYQVNCYFNIVYGLSSASSVDMFLYLTEFCMIFLTWHCSMHQTTSLCFSSGCSTQQMYFFIYLNFASIFLTWLAIVLRNT